jgi:hypothetical protein
VRQRLRDRPGKADDAITRTTERWIKAENNLMFLRSSYCAGEFQNRGCGAPWPLEPLLDLLELKGRYTHNPRMPTRIPGST